jgi:hypothetical protein
MGGLSLKKKWASRLTHGGVNEIRIYKKKASKSIDACLTS